MFWGLIMLFVLGSLLMKLGALSVTVKVMGLALYIAVAVILIMVIAMLWRKLFGGNGKSLTHR